MPRFRNGSPYRRAKWLAKVPPSRPLKEHAGTILFTRKHFVPSSHLRLVDALDEYGWAKVDGWTGKEAEARRTNTPPDPPWLWNIASPTTPTYFTFDDHDEVTEASQEDAEVWWAQILPVLEKEAAAENAARDRWYECWSLFRDALAGGELRAEILATNGNFYDVPERIWRSDEAPKALNSGRLEFLGRRVYTEAPKHQGLVVFEIEGFRAAVRGELTVPESPEAALDPARYPYLAFMLRAARELAALHEDVPLSKQVKDWLRKNWPSDLGERPETKVANMATFLRRPEDEKGGNRPQRSGPSKH